MLIGIVAANGGNPRQLQLQFQKRRGITDAQLLLQSSVTLSSWTDQDPAALNPIITDIDAQTEQWIVLIPLSGGQQFYRLKAQY